MKQMDSTIVDYGIDWLTATTHNDNTGYWWYELCLKYQEQLGKRYGKVVDWRNKWYVGHRGEFWQWGYSQGNNGYIVIFTSQGANDMYHRVVGSAQNTTRIDNQVTVRLTQQDSGLLDRAYVHLCDNGLTRAKNTALIANNQGGKTLYIGSRQSESFLRAYDKGIESGTDEPGLKYRFEIERKGVKAERMAATLNNAITEPELRARFIRTDVFNGFAMRGFTPPFEPEISELVMEVGFVAETSIDRKIAWLRKQVAPTVQMLAENDMLAEAIEALGLARPDGYGPWVSQRFDTNT